MFTSYLRASRKALAATLTFATLAVSFITPHAAQAAGTAPQHHTTKTAKPHKTHPPTKATKTAKSAKSGKATKASHASTSKAASHRKGHVKAPAKQVSAKPHGASSHKSVKTASAHPAKGRASHSTARKSQAPTATASNGKRTKVAAAGKPAKGTKGPKIVKTHHPLPAKTTHRQRATIASYRPAQTQS